MRKKQQMEEIINYVKDLRDEEGYAVIDVNLQEGMLYNPLSISKNRDINSEIYDYIDEQANIIPAEIPLKIRFHGDVPPEEHEQIKKMMKRHYDIKSYNISWDVASNFYKMVVLSIVGVIFLAAYFYFSLTYDEEFFAEILSIIGSFSLWEAADALLLERPRLRRERMNLEQNIKQIIEFVND